MKRCTVWLAGIALVLGVLAVVVYALRGAVLAPLVEGLLVKEAQTRLGVRITVGGIGGSYLTGLEITGVATVAGSGAGPVIDLGVKRVAAHYSLPAVLLGIDAFLARMAIEVDGARLALDLDRGGPTEGGRGGGPPALPAVLPALRVDDAAVTVRGHGGRVEAGGIALEGHPGGEGRVRLRVAHLAWAYPGLRPGTTSLSAELAFSPEAMVVEHLFLGEAEVVERARLALAGPSGTATLGARLRAGGGAVGLTGTLDRGALVADVQVDGVALGPLSALVEGPSFGGNLAGHARLRLDPSRPLDLAGDLTAEVSDFVVRDIHVDRLVVQTIAADGTLRVERLDLQAGDNTARLAGSVPLAALLAGEAARLVAAVTATFSASLTDVPAALHMAGVTAAAPARPAPPHRLVADGEVSGGTVRIAQAELETAGVTLALEEGEATWPGAGQPLADTAVRGRLRVAAADLAPLGAVLSLPPLRGSLHGAGEVTGTLAAPRGSAALDGHDLSLGGLPIDTLTLRATADARRLVVDVLEARHGDDRVTGAGAVDLTTGRIAGAGLAVAIHEVAPYLGPWLPRDWPVGGALEGSITLAGEITAPEGSLAATFRDARLGGLAIPKARLRARGTGGEIVIESLAAQTSAGDVAAAGAVTRAAGDGVQVDLDALALSWQGRGLALAAPARLTLGRAGPYTVDRLVLSGEVGTVELAGVLAPAGESDLTLGLHDLTSDGWLDALVGERVTFSGLDATLHVAGTRAAPRLAVACGVRRLGGTGRVVSFTGAFDLAYGDRRLQVSRCDWSAAAGQRLTITASLPLDPETPGWLAPGAVALDATLDLPDLGWLGDLLPPDLRSDGSVSATAVLAGTWDHPVGRVDVAVHGLSLPAALQPAPPGLYTAAVTVAVDGHDLSLEDLRIDAPGAHLTATGTWSDFPSVRPFLVTGDDRPLAGAVHLDGAFALSELGWAAARLEGVQRLAGAIEGEVAVDGPARAPRAVARLAVTDGEVRLATGVPAVRAIHATAEVTPGAVRITDARGEVGGAPFRLTGSVTRPAGGKPVVELALTGTNLLLFRGEGVKVRADTDLHVRGPLARLAVAGELAITDGRLVKNVDLLSVLPGWGTPPARGGVQLFSIPAPPLRDATLHVRVTTKKPFEIKSNVARGTVRPELLLQGTGEIPVVQGEVYVDPIRISLPAGILRVESGVVRFLADDPDRPRLDLSGRARMLGYDISVVVEGPYDEPVVTVSSVPPLLEEELLLLLLTGHPPKTGATQAATHAAGMNVAVYVGKGLLARLFSDQSAESDESVLDRFEVEIGRGVTRAGQETIDAQFRLAEGVVRDGDVLYITTEKDVYDDVNAGLKIVFRFK